MATSADQMQFVAFDTVNQKLVGLDMGFAVTLPNAPQGMVAIAFGQRLLVD